jgi:sugar lactone lactonase YvrE
VRRIELVTDARAALGECPRWRAAEARLYWVDIANRRLHRTDPVTGETQTRTFAAPVGCFAFRRGGGLMLAMKDGFAALETFDGPLTPFAAQVLADRPDHRFNDGRADAQGRFWAGTINMTKSAADAGLWRLSPDGGLVEAHHGALTSNGLAFSPDQKTLYWSDTPAHTVWAFDFDLESGEISGKRLFHQFPQGLGRPDGASVDEDGFYWSALYDGGRVVRLSPAGEIVEEVPVPARHVTMIGFGGPDRRTAFVTTARQGTGDADLERFPEAGGVFRFRVETPGLAEYDFGA